MINVAAAPSVKKELFAAVWVPAPFFTNAGLSFANCSGVEAALNVQPSNLVTDQDVQAQQDRTQITDKFMGLSKRYNMDMSMRNA